MFPTGLPALAHCLTCLSLLLEVERRRAEEEDWEERRSSGNRRLPALPPPPGAAAWQQVRAGAVLLMCFFLGQIKTDLSWLAEPREAGAFLLMAITIFGPLLVAPALFPLWWERRRWAMYTATRLVFFSLPVMRNKRAVAHILQMGQPTEGALGLVKDMWLMLLGTRTVALLIGTVFSPCPIVPSLLLTVFAMMRCRNPEDMCSRPMLRHPLWQQRISGVHRELEGMHLLLRSLDPFWMVFWGTPSANDAVVTGANRSADEKCHSFVTFTQLLFGIVLPTLLVARMQAGGCMVQWWQQQSGSSSDMNSSSSGMNSSSSGMNSSSSGMDSSSLQAASSCGPQRLLWRSCWSRSCTWLRRAALAADARLLHLCTILNWQGSSWPTAAAAWAMVVSLVYVAAVELERPSPLATVT